MLSACVLSSGEWMHLLPQLAETQADYKALYDTHEEARAYYQVRWG